MKILSLNCATIVKNGKRYIPSGVKQYLRKSANIPQHQPLPQTIKEWTPYVKEYFGRLVRDTKNYFTDVIKTPKIMYDDVKSYFNLTIQKK